MIKLKDILTEVEGERRHEVVSDKTLLNEDISIILDILWKLGTLAIGFGFWYIFGKILDGVLTRIGNAAAKVITFVAPMKWQKFLKRLSANKEFVKQFVAELKLKGGPKFLKGNYIMYGPEIMTSIPAFKQEFEKFCKEENIDKKDAEELRQLMLKQIGNALSDETKETVEILLKKNPKLKEKLKNDMDFDLKEMIASDKTDGRIKQMLKKMQKTYPSMTAINYNTSEKTYLFAFGKKSDAEKLENDFSKVKGSKRMKLIRSADYPNDKPPTFIKQYEIITEAWLKPASPLIEADSPTERTRRYNRKNKKKVRAYLRKTQDDRVARNSDRAKAVKKHGKSKMKNHDVHHPNGAQNGGARLAKKDHGPDCKDGNSDCGSKYS